MKRFGDLLREERMLSGKSMGELARHLSVSITYMSDVERNARPPLSEDRIRSAACFLGKTAEPLLRAAAVSAPLFRFRPGSEKGREFGAALQRGLDQLTDKDFEELIALLNSKVKEQP